MVLQPSAFQQSPVPTKGTTWWRRIAYELKAGPFLSPLDQDAWQRGYADVPKWTRSKPFLFEALVTAAAGGFGISLGSAWWERGLFGALFAVAGFGLALIAIWLWHCLVAPTRQRNEARSYARSLEKYTEEYRRWARRREIAEDFRRNTLEYAATIAVDGYAQAPLEELDSYWRNNADAYQSQLEGFGASSEVISEFVRQREALDTKDDNFANDERRRIRNNMMTTCQNVFLAVRDEEPPPPPAPPRAE